MVQCAASSIRRGKQLHRLCHGIFGGDARWLRLLEDVEASVSIALGSVRWFSHPVRSEGSSSWRYWKEALHAEAEPFLLQSRSTFSSSCQDVRTWKRDIVASDESWRKEEEETFHSSAGVRSKEVFRLFGCSELITWERMPRFQRSCFHYSPWPPHTRNSQHLKPHDLFVRGGMISRPWSLHCLNHVNVQGVQKTISSSGAKQTGGGPSLGSNSGLLTAVNVMQCSPPMLRTAINLCHLILNLICIGISRYF